MTSLLYDIANWKPVTFPRYVSLISQCALTAREPATLTTTIEPLDDGRIRLVTSAEVKTPDQPWVSADEPYLMIIHDPEQGTDACFHRSDRDLASS